MNRLFNKGLRLDWILFFSGQKNCGLGPISLAIKTFIETLNSIVRLKMHEDQLTLRVEDFQLKNGPESGSAAPSQRRPFER